MIANLLGIGGGGGAAAGSSTAAAGGVAGGAGAAASAGLLAGGAGHVVTLLAAAVVTAGGAVELQKTIIVRPRTMCVITRSRAGTSMRSALVPPRRPRSRPAFRVRTTAPGSCQQLQRGRKRRGVAARPRCRRRPQHGAGPADPVAGPRSSPVPAHVAGRQPLGREFRNGHATGGRGHRVTGHCDAHRRPAHPAGHPAVTPSPAGASGSSAAGSSASGSTVAGSSPRRCAGHDAVRAASGTSAGSVPGSTPSAVDHLPVIERAHRAPRRASAGSHRNRAEHQRAAPARRPARPEPGPAPARRRARPEAEPARARARRGPEPAPAAPAAPAQPSPRRSRPVAR